MCGEREHDNHTGFDTADTRPGDYPATVDASAHRCGQHTAAHTVHPSLDTSMRTTDWSSKIGELHAKTVPKKPKTVC